MSFGLFGNEFCYFGNEFSRFFGNEFRSKRAKKKPAVYTVDFCYPRKEKRLNDGTIFIVNNSGNDIRIL